MICWKASDFEGGCENGRSISRLIVVQLLAQLVVRSFVRIRVAEGVSNE